MQLNDTSSLNDRQRTAAGCVRAGIVPIVCNGKSPIESDWPHKPLPTEEQAIAQFADLRHNIGGRLGNRIADIDLDHPTARQLAPDFLPPTATYGRKTNPRSHYLYRVTDGDDWFHEYANPDGGKPILEYRADPKHQTILPGSRHPDTGEVYEWSPGSGFDTIRDISRAELERACGNLYVATILSTILAARPGARHNVLLPLAGGLATNGYPRDDAETLFTAVARTAGLDMRDVENAIASSYDRLDAGIKEITGYKTLGKHLDKQTVALIRKYTGTESEIEGCLSVDDFYAFLPKHTYIHRATREMWEKAGVNAAVASIPNGDNGTIPASVWLDRNRPVHQMTWMPGGPEVLEDVVMREGGLQPYPGARIYNTYVAPTLDGGDATLAGPWVDHAKRLYPEDWQHLIQWFAQRVQQPGDKINHGIVLGGAPGIGKDALLEPVAHAVGPWNVGEVAPSVMSERFNPYLQNVILRVSEARDLGETDRYAFYERSKTILAAPPETLRIDSKYMPEYRIPNVVGVVFTTNHRTGALYLPADDRRHYVAWSDVQASEFDAGYFDRLFAWYAAGGLAHVRAYLATYDLPEFNPKAPPPKTDAFWAMVDAERTPEEGELSDLIDRLGTPAAVTLETLKTAAGTHALHDLWSVLSDRRARRRVPHLLRAVGYRPVRNSYADDGMWRIHQKRQAVYAREALPVREQIAAAQRLVERAGVTHVREVTDPVPLTVFASFSHSERNPDGLVD